MPIYDQVTNDAIRHLLTNEIQCDKIVNFM